MDNPCEGWFWVGFYFVFLSLFLKICFFLVQFWFFFVIKKNRICTKMLVASNSRVSPGATISCSGTTREWSRSNHWLLLDWLASAREHPPSVSQPHFELFHNKKSTKTLPEKNYILFLKKMLNNKIKCNPESALTGIIHHRDYPSQGLSITGISHHRD